MIWMLLQAAVMAARFIVGKETGIGYEGGI